MKNSFTKFALLVGAALSLPQTARAQEAPTPTPAHSQVISINPIGVVFGVLSAEYERAYQTNSTIGVAATLYSTSGWDYLSADAKYRYYPQGQALKGFSIGGSVGGTYMTTDVNDVCRDYYYDCRDVEDESAFVFGVGVGLDYQWLLGPEEKFAVTVGAGGKRLFGVGDLRGASAGYPTLRLSVGYAF